MPVFFTEELDTVATYWRICRADGIALAFTSHDRALSFGGLFHHAAPGMIPSAIRLTDSIEPDSAEVEGALSHDLISSTDLLAGAYDGAEIVVGAVNWETLEHAQIYSGTIGKVDHDGLHFSAELKSSKHLLDRDLVPRTSPTCRAEFCDKACGLNPQLYSHLITTSGIDLDNNRVQAFGIDLAKFDNGSLRFCSGPQIGTTFGIIEASSAGIVLDRPLAADAPDQSLVILREGCDHTLQECRTRFSNAVNFRGEPFLPGNDHLARYPKPQ